MVESLTPEQQARVVQEAKSWVGTPYHPGARIKGVGVDCAMLLAEVYENAGLLPHVDPGNYPPDFGLHRDEERFLEHLSQYSEQVEELEPGDAVVFKFGRCFSHGAVYIGEGYLVHAVLRDSMVTISTFDSAELAGREARFYRVVHGR